MPTRLYIHWTLVCGEEIKGEGPSPLLNGSEREGVFNHFLTTKVVKNA
jgi:hypothetical protein